MRFDQLTRREAIALGCVGAARPLAASGQPAPARSRRIGVLGSLPLQPLDSFRSRLRELGYVEGRTIVIESRFAHGKDERYPELAAELLAAPLDLIVAWGTPAALAAKKATTRVPILLVAGDVVNTGLVTSLSRPEANLTGFVALNVELEEKRLELLKELVPRLARAGILLNSLNPLNRINLETARRTGARLAVTIEPFEVRNSGDVASALQRLIDARVDAALLGSDTLLLNERQQIADTMRAHRIPAIYPFREYLDTNPFIVYGANISVLFRGIADYADRILKGEQPGHLPVQQATAFELVVNLKEAKRLGLSVPPTVLVRADEVIE
ncbi:MAG: ABC transporter substrate-binding protein [Hyphomicrobiales bacterium]|nr:ABC transporter substrate-binding protein [Hyphomicrobiales bacterium]